ncbi:Retinoblastoma-like protein 2 [Sciurus carolinensis]|uniref:Retinoblastoma-like protein 2 n=1 Tax=Sciurus carolinensis TaxID=30640 RepID=A0AA41MNB9_SCICA|nr:Retinoblastoma-like protein 2 [Sciurus carolinensis]
MPSGGDLSPPPPPPPPATAGSDEEEEDDGEAEDAAQPAGSPTPQIQQRFDELCSRLNMDEAARAEAWDSYRSMSESYTLEVRSGEEARGFLGLVGAPRRRDGLPSPSVSDPARQGSPDRPGIPGPSGLRAPGSVCSSLRTVVLETGS